jgi:GNAT superfamily N-acetyltransferase
MITISEATTKDFKTIREIAFATWPVVYGEILSKAQINFMLDSFYSEETLIANLTQKEHHFFVLKKNEICLGFASYEHHYLNSNSTRLHKFYLLTEHQGKGMGKLMLDKIVALAKENRSDKLSLNVNRFNKAFVFYQKMGFEIIAEEDISIGQGYLMEDYIMEKQL